MSFDWAGHANATINKYIRKEVLAIIRKRVLLAMLQSRGRISNGNSGKVLDWKVRHKRTTMRPFSDSGTVTFARQDKRKTAQMPMRAYTVAQSINESDKLQNSGNEAIVKLYAGMIKELLDDIRDQFCEELVTVDGYAAGSDDRIMGLESMFGASSSGSSLAGTNSDSYGQLSTTRGAYGGSWSGTWPDGRGSSQYDFWTPLVVNYTGTLAAGSGGWSSATKTWYNTCVEAIRYAILNTARNGDDLDFILLEKNLYRLLLDHAELNERLVVNRNQDSAMTKLGFKGINVDGTDIYWEVGLNSGVGYGLCMDKMELCSWQKQLFVNKSDFDLETVSDRALVQFYGNLKIECPRTFCKFAALG